MVPTKQRDGATMLRRIAELEEEVARLQATAETDAATHARDRSDIGEMQASHTLSGFAAAANRREILAGWTDLAESRAETRQLLEQQASTQAQNNRIGVAFAELEAVFEVMPVDLGVLDGDLRYVRVNEILAQFNGIPAAEHIGRTVREVVPDVAASVEAILRRVFETGEPMDALEFEASTPGSGGQTKFWSESAKPLQDAEGRSRFVLVSVADITARKRAEQALAKSEAYWRSIFERLHEGFYVGEVVRDASGRGVDWRFIETNTAWETLTGLSREAALGRRITEVIPGIAAVWIDSWIRVVETGEPATVNNWVEPLGSWYEAHAFRLDSERFAVLFLNTTDRTRAELALRESEARFRAAVRAVSGVLWTNRADGRMDGEQPGWAALTGQSFAQYQGYGWTQAVHPEDAQATLDAWNAAVADGRTFIFEHRLRCADGRWRHFAVRAIPVEKPDGGISEWVGVHTDVTDQREAEAVLSRDKAELERLVEERTAALLREVEERRKAEEALRQGEKMQAIGELTGGIAHDFNNIIQVVASGATLLRHPRLTEERKTHILDEVAKAAHNAKQLTGHLLAFARKQALEPQAFAMDARLEGMSELLSRALGSGIRVETDFAPDAWPVFVDPSQLEITLLNLALNARDAMPQGGTLTLQTRNVVLEASGEQQAGDYVCLTVRDTGEGMPPAVLARVFEPYFTTKGPGRGTGLGLAQVHGFAKQSGGNVAIESTPGQGTTITLHLPRAVQGAQRDAPPSRAKDGAGVAMQQAAGKTVLVVEDNANVAQFACSMLEGLGYSTRQAGSAADALRLLEAGEPVDAVFSDVVMPGDMSGAQLARLLRQQRPRLAVVLATGYSQALTEWNGQSVAEVLYKPYTLDNLAAALERAFATVETDTQSEGTGQASAEK